MPGLEDDVHYRGFIPNGIPWEVANRLAHVDLVVNTDNADDLLRALLNRGRALEEEYRDDDVIDLLEAEFGIEIVFKVNQALSDRTLVYLGIPDLLDLS